MFLKGSGRNWIQFFWYSSTLEEWSCRGRCNLNEIKSLIKYHQDECSPVWAEVIEIISLKVSNLNYALILLSLESKAIFRNWEIQQLSLLSLALDKSFTSTKNRNNYQSDVRFSLLGWLLTLELLKSIFHWVDFQKIYKKLFIKTLFK